MFVCTVGERAMKEALMKMPTIIHSNITAPNQFKQKRPLCCLLPLYVKEAAPHLYMLKKLHPARFRLN